MKDTSDKMDSLYLSMMMERSAEDRFLMGCEMFETSKQLVVSSLKEQDPNLSIGDLRKNLFLRFYGFEYGGEEKQKIIETLTIKT